MNEVIVEQKGKPADLANSRQPPKLALPEENAKPGTRKKVFALDEGDVVLTFPVNLSVASYDDLAAHMEIFLRKMKRRAATVE